jgi:hypothetical protein
MRVLTALAVLTTALATAGVAAAGDQTRQARASAGERAVLVCATDVATRRAFTREHGAAPVFLTAREALSIRPSDPAWSAPRCMTAREHARYRDAALTYAAVR